MVKYRVHSDYFATGEGRTISILYCHAENDAEALKQFHKMFGVFYAAFAVIEREWHLDDDLTESMVPSIIIKMMKDDLCYHTYHSQYHVNCS